ncbi:MAG: ribonuclease P protein component [Candidatus Pacebacteria bacterium]|nr:ribonuclease P protein component [Candidatus Paceibacterota bacterium]
MLSKRARLTTAEVKKVLDLGRGRRGALLGVKVLSAPAPFKCAVVVSKKLAKTAVARNRARRAAYEALRKSSLPLSGHAILFVQALPKDQAVAAFTIEIKKLLHV